MSQQTLCRNQLSFKSVGVRIFLCVGITHLCSSLVPQPTVSITSNRTGVLYAGTPLTLNCSIQLNPAVDTTVMVTRMWRGPRSQVVSNSSHVTVSNLVERSAFLYKTTFHFDPLSTTDSGNYKCEATVTPDPQSRFVLRTTGNDMHAVNVKGESSLRCNCVPVRHLRCN